MTPRGGGAKECIVSPDARPPTPERVRKFQGATRPAPGEKRILHSFAGDTPPNPVLRHGVVTKASLEVGLETVTLLWVASSLLYVYSGTSK